MSDLQVTNSFVDGDTVLAANFNTNYSDIVTYVNNRNSGASTWDAMYSTHGTNIPLIANNSTGTDSIIQAKDNGTTVLDVMDGGYVSFSSQTFGEVTKSSNQSFSSNPSLVTFDTITQNGSEFSTSDSRLTCAVGGLYFISVRLLVSAPTTFTDTDIGMHVNKNSTRIFFHRNTEALTTLSVFPTYIVYRYCDVINLAQGDYIEIYVNKANTGGTPSVVADWPLAGTGKSTKFTFQKLS